MYTNGFIDYYQVVLQCQRLAFAEIADEPIETGFIVIKGAPSTLDTVAPLPIEKTISSVAGKEGSTTAITGTIIVSGAVVTSISARSNVTLFEAVPSTVSQANSNTSSTVLGTYFCGQIIVELAEIGFEPILFSCDCSVSCIVHGAKTEHFIRMCASVQWCKRLQKDTCVQFKQLSTITYELLDI